MSIASAIQGLASRALSEQLGSNAATGSTLARRINLKILYESTDISADITKYLKSFSFGDVMSGAADDIDITLEDREELWQGDWLPARGAILTVSLITKAWSAADDEDHELPVGQFEIDEIENSSPPNEVKIKGVSIPNNAEIRGIEKNHSWEKANLSVIAKDIATGAGLELYYDTADDPNLERAEQTEQTDLEFLMKLCKDEGLALKISDRQIIIFDEQKYEKADPVRTITKGSTAVKTFSIKSSIHNIYKACHVKYKESKKNELIEFTFIAPDKKDSRGMTLQVNEQVANIAEAEKMAKKKLREKNREEITISMSMVGSFDLLSSNTVTLSGFHVFDGKYIIIKGKHDIGSGYGVNIDLRKVLDGY